MKRLKILYYICPILLFFAFGNKPDNVQVSGENKLDANNISTAFTNYGFFNYGIAGAHFKAGQELRKISGIWIGATVNSSIRLAVSDFQNRNYLPGYTDNNGNPQGKDDPAFRVYKIEHGLINSEDYLHWPSSQGAYLNSAGKPYLLGNQTLFYSYTDGYSEAHLLTPPLKVQILQTNWEFNFPGALDFTVLSELRIINRSNEIWNDAYIGFWSNDSLGGDSWNAICSDSGSSLGYTYEIENGYSAGNYAVGFKILNGPFKFTGNNNDSVVYYYPPGSDNKIVKRGYRNLSATSNNILIKGNPGNGDPQTADEYYNVLKGMKKNGEPWIDPYTNSTTNFPCTSENYVSGTTRILLSSGPLNINPGDTQVVVIAQICSRGTSDYQAIRSLTSEARIIQEIFDYNFEGIQNNNIISEPIQLPSRYKLYQNFPNPFNPVTKIKYSIPESGNINLTVYDIQRERSNDAC